MALNNIRAELERHMAARDDEAEVGLAEIDCV